jgi:hypothetical protein
MEGGNCKVLEVEPGGIKEAASVMHQAVDDGAAVELSAHSIEKQTRVDRQGFEGTLGDLRGMCTFENRHAWLNLGVQGRREAPDLDQNQVLWDKGQFVHGIGRRSHNDNNGLDGVCQSDGAPLKTTPVWRCRKANKISLKQENCNF